MTLESCLPDSSELAANRTERKLKYSSQTNRMRYLKFSSQNNRMRS